jgi:hypothetical protein
LINTVASSIVGENREPSHVPDGERHRQTEIIGTTMKSISSSFLRTALGPIPRVAMSNEHPGCSIAQTSGSLVDLRRCALKC